MDRYECRAEVNENIEYQALCRQFGHEDVECVAERMTAFDCLRRNTTEIRNIRAYLLTALYNAPATMSVSYQAQVQHDFGP